MYCVILTLLTTSVLAQFQFPYGRPGNAIQGSSLYPRKTQQSTFGYGGNSSQFSSLGTRNTQTTIGRVGNSNRQPPYGPGNAVSIPGNPDSLFNSLCSYPRIFTPTLSNCNRVCAFPYRGLPYQTKLCDPCNDPKTFFYINSTKSCSELAPKCIGVGENCGVVFKEFYSQMCVFEEGKPPATVLKSSPGVNRSYTQILDDQCPMNPLLDANFNFCDQGPVKQANYCTGGTICRFRNVGIPFTSRYSCRCGASETSWKNISCEGNVISCKGNQTDCSALLGTKVFCAFEKGKRPFLIQNGSDMRGTYTHVMANRCPFKTLYDSEGSTYIAIGVRVCRNWTNCKSTDPQVCAEVKGKIKLYKNVCELCKVSPTILSYKTKYEDNPRCP